MSVVPQARKTLSRNLTGSDALQKPVRVNYGWPQSLGQREVILFGPDPTDTDWVTLGEQSADNYFSLPVGIHVCIPGKSSEESDDIADEMLDAVYEVIAADPTLNGLLLLPILPALGPWRNWQTPTGWKTQILLNARCRARTKRNG